MDNQLDVLGISHLGLAVTRLEQFIDTWGLVLGISDWWIRDDVEESGVEVDGVPQEDLRVRLGYARLGGLCLELVETVTGETCHSKSAEVFGPGLHHVAFWVNDLDREVEKALSMGLTGRDGPFHARGTRARRRGGSRGRRASRPGGVRTPRAKPVLVPHDPTDPIQLHAGTLGRQLSRRVPGPHGRQAHSAAGAWW